MLMISCKHSNDSDPVKIIFLHHSTGLNIWNGGRSSIPFRMVRKVKRTLGMKNYNVGRLEQLFARYNRHSNKNYQIVESSFPKKQPYGWNNNPFDYYNIWVKNGGMQPYMEEPTLEMLTGEFQVIMLKHCFPVSNIQPDRDSADIDSDYRSLANFKLQYLALREKFHQFPDNKFIVWTGAAHIKSKTTEEESIRFREFYNWVIKEWDIPGDNIYIWDFYQLQTEGDLYFLDQYAQSADNAHPNDSFSKIASKLLFKRLIDIIENDGLKTKLTGEELVNGNR